MVVDTISSVKSRILLNILLDSGSVVSRLDMFRTNVLMYRTMVLLARQTQVRRQTCEVDIQQMSMLR
jgi:hypothetical protein